MVFCWNCGKALTDDEVRRMWVVESPKGGAAWQYTIHKCSKCGTRTRSSERI